MKRREIIKWAAVTPAVGAIIGSLVPFQSVFAAPDVKLGPKRNLIKELGLRTFINAAGTYTTMTASLMNEEVMEAIDDSSREFIMLNEVQDKVGEKIAQMVHSEAAMVTAGAFSALTLGMAGILTGTDQEKIKQLPHRLDEAGIKSEVIIQKAHFDGYEHALSNTGISLVPVETANDVDRAVNQKSASMHFLNCNTLEGKIKHEEWLQLAKKHNLPATIDIAADVPPVSNLWKFNDMGFSFVALSGGKAICGPQSAGVLMGKKNIVAAARLNDSPNGRTIGRGMKVNKEEMLGMYAALDSYLKRDHDKEWKMWEDRVAAIKGAVTKVKGVEVTVTVPPIANHSPKMNIKWDREQTKIVRSELGDRLRQGNPSIEVIAWGDDENSIDLTVFMLKPGQEKIVGKRIFKELSKASS
ncbi:L-seryl-tRNA(Ser) seleniumtransferase [Pricia antarctica]|uniref:L-seryl-tRNA(Ser) seleniumtransferase n=1 Tax=Pricia antarctica TaxID=641691 RepID=A0A1G6WPJ1_9FLAO|nr:selenocysteine synthase [Pricia antarctica]SDD67704.1 L-seryl-tRNA(Ser) seleniumtransferase [Pricia antarctica]